MIADHRYIEQETAPRIEGGVDHGGEAKVLIRTTTHTLLWRMGRKYWSGVGRPQAYAPAQLEMTGERCTRFGMHRNLGNFEERGVRLHEALRRNRAEIDAVFGPGATSMIDVKRTLVLG